VSVAKDGGLGIAETARRLSVSPETITNWVKLAQEGRDFAKQSAAGDVDAKKTADCGKKTLGYAWSAKC
jgi:Transposase.